MAFLVGSAKRKEIFLEIASCNNSKHQQLLDFLKIGGEDDEFDESMVAIESGSKRHHIPKFCATCWNESVSTLSSLIAKYITVFDLQSSTRTEVFYYYFVYFYFCCTLTTHFIMQ